MLLALESHSDPEYSGEESPVGEYKFINRRSFTIVQDDEFTIQNDEFYAQDAPIVTLSPPKGLLFAT